MDIEQQTHLDGKTLIIARKGMPQERWDFATEREAVGRAAIIEEALTWKGTPFRNCADIKGRAGGVDCAMLLVRAYVDTGRLPPFDPRPYPPHWMLHRSEERFLAWIEKQLGGERVSVQMPGDVVVWQFGRCFSHGGILINSLEVVHAYYVAGCTLISRLEEDTLRFVSVGNTNLPRPRLFFRIGGTW